MRSLFCPKCGSKNCFIDETLPSGTIRCMDCGYVGRSDIQSGIIKQG